MWVKGAFLKVKIQPRVTITCDRLSIPEERRTKSNYVNLHQIKKKEIWVHHSHLEDKPEFLLIACFSLVQLTVSSIATKMYSMLPNNTSKEKKVQDLTKTLWKRNIVKMDNLESSKIKNFHNKHNKVHFLVNTQYPPISVTRFVSNAAEKRYKQRLSNWVTNTFSSSFAWFGMICWVSGECITSIYFAANSPTWIHFPLRTVLWACCLLLMT